MKRGLITVLMVFLFSAVVQAVAVDDKPLADPVLEARARILMKEFRCLVCQNQSIEDSNAGLAQDLRMIVRERVALGDSPEDVRAYMVERYGDWVLLRPPVKSSTYFLWASPFLIVLIILLVVVGRRRSATPPNSLSDEETAQLARLLGDEK